MKMIYSKGKNGGCHKNITFHFNNLQQFCFSYINEIWFATMRKTHMMFFVFIRLSRKMHKGMVYNLQGFSLSRMSTSLQEPIKEDLHIYVLYKPETRRRYILSCTVWEHLNDRVFFLSKRFKLSWYPTISKRFFFFWSKLFVGH